MNENTLPRLLTILCVSLGLLLGGCSAAKEQEQPPLAGARIGGPFTLTDQKGRQVSSSDFEGKYRLVYFGFASCPDVCPVDLQVIGQSLRQLEKSDPTIAAKVQPIFITVDPERDTPPVMGRYVSLFHPRLIGLTGTPKEIAAVAKAHGIYYSKQGEGSDYMVDHARMVLLFGPKGEPIAIIPHEKGANGMTAELRKWVR